MEFNRYDIFKDAVMRMTFQMVQLMIDVLYYM